ncbi:MAG: hypothetical protein Q4Q03_03550, partial [Bowdeniella nasicola]|nr:hypothetical protein [Bowdeniella nasicola]
MSRTYLVILIGATMVALIFRRMLPLSVFLFVIALPLTIRIAILGFVPDPPLAEIMPEHQGLSVNGRAITTQLPF